MVHHIAFIYGNKKGQQIDVFGNIYTTNVLKKGQKSNK
jgi:hypothetical protein